MKSLAEVKRSLKPGQQFYCVNQLHPEVSGWRTVRKVQTTNLSYECLGRDGSLHIGWTDWPKRDRVRIAGDRMEFLNEDGSVAFTYLFGIVNRIQDGLDVTLEFRSYERGDTRARDAFLGALYRTVKRTGGSNLPGYSKVVGGGAIGVHFNEVTFYGRASRYVEHDNLVQLLDKQGVAA